MILRAVIFAAGLTGAAGLSQFPEYSQQYVQRLGGAVDALGQVVADFDASAIAEGLTREAALEHLQGTPFLDRRQGDMTAAMARHARLAGHLDAMRAAGPFMRAYHIGRLDPEIARATWADFQPAMPLTFAGAVFGGTGFLAGILLAGAFLGLLRRLPGLRRTTT